jgi:stage II sporulation protein D
VVPPIAIGGRYRRYAIRPRPLVGLALVLFGAGIALTASIASVLWLVTGQNKLPAEVEALTAQVAALTERVEALQAGRVSHAPAAAAPDATPAPQPEKLALRLPTVDAAPTIRVAILRAKGSVELRGEGLILVTGKDKAIPMPGGLAIVRKGPGGIFIEGVGTLPDGTPVENRLGPIQIGDQVYPGRLELHRDGDALLLVNELDLERYVQGVVAAEVPSSFGMEAKKAQVVAARTYALMQRAAAEGPFHVTATVDDQVYRGSAADGPTMAAVATTHGEVLSIEGYLVSAYFSSTCGGRTEDPIHVWPDRLTRGVRSVTCGHCDAAPFSRWTQDLSPERLAGALRDGGYDGIGDVVGLHIRGRSPSGRVIVLDVETTDATVTLSGQELRAAVGWTPIKSATFDVEVRGGSFHFEGSGFGHGVGLCQYGAQGMDRSGATYREILGLYYPDAKVEKIY